MGSESPILDYAGPQERPRRNWRWLVVGLLLVAIMVVVGLEILSASNARVTPSYVICRGNLSYIAAAVLMYQMDNGAFPTTLAETYPYIKDVKRYICPESGDKPLPVNPPKTQPATGLLTPGACSYIYLGATLPVKPPKSSPPAILLYERQPFHGGRMCIAFTDGTARFVDAKETAYILSELAAGHNPPRKR